MRHYLSEGSKKRAAIKSKKDRLMKFLSEEYFYDMTDEESRYDIKKVNDLKEVERRQLK